MTFHDQFMIFGLNYCPFEPHFLRKKLMFEASFAALAALDVSVPAGPGRRTGPAEVMEGGPAKNEEKDAKGRKCRRNVEKKLEKLDDKNLPS